MPIALYGSSEQIKRWTTNAEWWADFAAMQGRDWQEAYDAHLLSITAGNKARQSMYEGQIQKMGAL